MSREPNVIFVGTKPALSYVMAIITSFAVPDIKEVVLKARGRAIVNAVNVAEITKRIFIYSNVSKVTIGTEEVPLKEGGSRMVSTIEITLTRV